MNVTATDANGDCGFSNSDDVTTNEPSGANPLFLKIPLSRDGTLGRVVVYWIIVSGSTTFNSSDVQKTNGKVEFRNGK